MEETGLHRDGPAADAGPRASLLVIGYGSIGARHARLAAALGADVACVTSHPGAPFPRFASIAHALAESRPGHVVIANATGLHAQTLQELARAGFDGRVLVEKPLCSTLDEIDEMPAALPFHVAVAYNLRFHPLIQALRDALAGRPLYSACFYAGQYLPQWRPDRDYRTSYSAHSDQGGGVLRDLSHEIDLALWLCGRPRSITAVGGHLSHLEIASDDVYSIVSRHERCPAVAISINYLDRTPQRVITINARDLTARVDLVGGTLILNDELIHGPTERDMTYRTQLKSFFDNNLSTMCDFAGGREVMQFIAAAETAAANQRWVHL
ncbi:Gfo/Idh/MocA family protein [Trinickia acidisoli]|uniref:Gfo/Idh/MocA family protein n=1 Tax=Trinickia acidisoli TaxID=2767482 RepID=UPI001A8D9FE8|nr:Gfo/Idh/MocA family oxidoreductase [Trinickia acidisoli]